ncbi:hypothetical protein CH352_18875 [Leptospira hartskeerlii]|uniref:RiboL-PSP-HEPN domain-containing protein n=1 Tax=Leptospira hartskeerlii TaxID=2023177 RepID=A0A2M9X872_9LEPT|nr:HEPN domain-containing protein [Leptospira hartskeerlii]PJZ23898.1 hypothetical protein CH357_18810 [Leptospira hartskeerlii]PJZ31920.1 hypothetical protein CH352_18875 [Leptospira hartskeerlii]
MPKKLQIYYKIMNSIAFSKFQETKEEIATLWEMHVELSGTSGQGRRNDRLSILNKTALVFVSASWESYIEDVIQESFEKLLLNVKEADHLPMKLRMQCVDEITNSKDPTAIWKISDKKWITYITDNKKKVLGAWIEKFHSPKSENIKDLFSNTVGIKDITKSWFWQRMNYSNAIEKLDDYLDIRGKIVHRLKTEEKIKKWQADDFLGHVSLLVEKTDNALKIHLESLTNVSPW